MIKNYKCFMAAVLGLIAFGTKSVGMEGLPDDAVPTGVSTVSATDDIIGDGYTVRNTEGTYVINMTKGRVPSTLLCMSTTALELQRRFVIALYMIAPENISGVITPERAFESASKDRGITKFIKATPATERALAPYVALFGYMNQDCVACHFTNTSFTSIAQMLSCRTTPEYLLTNLQKLVELAETDLSHLRNILGPVFKYFAADKAQRMNLVSLALNNFKDPMVAKNTYTCFKVVAPQYMTNLRSVPFLIKMLIETPINVPSQVFIDAYNDPLVRVMGALRTQEYAQACLPFVTTVASQIVRAVATDDTTDIVAGSGAGE